MSGQGPLERASICVLDKFIRKRKPNGVQEVAQTTHHKGAERSHCPTGTTA